MDSTRRGILATLGTVGIAGCAGVLPADRFDSVVSSRDGETPSSPGTPADEAETPPYGGETIPPTAHPGARGGPLTAGPLPGVDNPILTADDVTDFGDVTFVADPFLFVEEGEWYLFFEVYNEDRNRPDASIGCARSSDGREWEYEGLVLEKEYHTSFPLVWKWEGEYYTCPPTGRDVELWRATEFPHDWEFLGNAIDVEYYPHDPVFFRYDGYWWLVADRNYTDVMVYYSDDLESFDWTPHPGNPVVTDRLEAARPGGRPVVVGETPYLFFQDLAFEYGDKIRAYEVVELSTDAYRDREVPESPVLAESGTGWNADAMHTFDPWWVGDGWVCAVDGAVDGDWSIGLFYVPAETTPEADRVPYDLRFTDGYYSVGDRETVAVDHGGNGRPGTVYGGTPETRGGLDGLSLHDGGDRVVFPCPYAASLGGEAFSLVTYAESGATDRARTLLDYGAADGDHHLSVERTAEGRWAVAAGGEDGSVSFDAAAPALGEPTQVALTAGSDGGLALFVGAERQGTGEDPGPVAESNGNLVVGAERRGDRPWNGWVGPTGVFSTALSERELANVDGRIRDRE